ncbi:MAG: hypothetical protein KDD38_09920 [Bdellovibrionales bacterium]|nr:hypothetical protein [Bdellovibrionales bacterium]
MKVIITIFAFLISFSSTASALTFFGEGVLKKDKEKESTRWTLADWMTQKKSFNAMDHWLAMNRSLGLFEFNIEGGKQKYDLTVGGNPLTQEIDRYGASFYWSIFGLEYQLEDSDEGFKRESYQLNLRLLGASSQTTNLTAFYGVRNWTFDNPENEIKNNYAGAKLNIYITSFFGLEGQYKKYFTGNDNSNTEYDSERVEYGGFIDVYFIRFYGQAFKETTNKKTALGVKTSDEREGTEAGVKFYF